MKKTVALALCCALVITPLYNTEAVGPAPTGPKQHALIAICLIGGGALIGGVVVFMVKSCKPKYYCMKDEDGNRFYSNATRTERAANGWTVTGGPYDSPEEAAAGCVTTNPTLTNLGEISEQGPVDEVFIPQLPLKVWKSTDLINWAHVDTILDDPTHFSWTDTNAISGASKAFYRVSY